MFLKLLRTLLLISTIIIGDVTASVAPAEKPDSMEISDSICEILPNQYYSSAEMDFLSARKLARYYVECSDDQNLQEKYSKIAADIGVGLDAFNYAEILQMSEKYVDSVNYFLIGARRGDVDSMVALASSYASGIGVKANAEESIFWYTMAARLGDAGSADKLGEMLAGKNDPLSIAWKIVAVEDLGLSVDESKKKIDSIRDKRSASTLRKVDAILEELR